MSRLTLIFTIAIGLPSSAQEVSTEVDGDAGGTYFYEEYHPTKIDWHSVTFCAGRNASAENKTLPGIKKSSSQPEGGLEVSLDGNAPKSRLSTLVAQRLEWKTSFDKEDYVFHVYFKKQVNSGTTIHRRRPCNTRTWHYAVDQATSNIKTSVRVVVPENVWIVRIRPSVNLPMVKTRINQARLIGDVASMPAAQDGLELADQTNYFFVKPGDQIEIALEHADVKSNLELLADFELTFLGSNRCERYKEPSLLHADRIRADLERIAQDLINQRSGADLDEVILRLGCLTSPPVISGLLYENNLPQVNVLLNATSAFVSDVDHFIRDHGSERDVVAQAMRLSPLLVVDPMSRYSVGTSVMASLGPLCDRYPLVERGRTRSEMTGYLRYGKTLAQVRSLLHLDDEDGGLAAYYAGLADGYGKLEGQSPARLMNDRKESVLKFLSSFEKNNKTDVIAEATDLMNALPAIEPTRDLVEFVTLLGELRATAADVGGFFFDQARNFGAKTETAIQTAPLAQLSSRFADQYSRLKDRFSRLDDLFGGHMALNFADAIGDLSENHIRSVRPWFETAHGGFLKPFVEWWDGKSRFANRLADLRKCVLHPISETKW